MSEFKISLNPGIRPTQFRFVYNDLKDAWHVWQYDEINERDLLGGFHGWPPIGEDKSLECKGDLITTLCLNSGIGGATFKLYYDPIASEWSIWLRDEVKNKDYLTQFTIWPPRA